MPHTSSILRATNGIHDQERTRNGHGYRDSFDFSSQNYNFIRRKMMRKSVTAKKKKSNGRT